MRRNGMDAWTSKKGATTFGIDILEGLWDGFLRLRVWGRLRLRAEGFFYFSVFLGDKIIWSFGVLTNIELWSSAGPSVTLPLIPDSRAGGLVQLFQRNFRWRCVRVNESIVVFLGGLDYR